MAKVKWQARQAVIKFEDDASITLDASAALDTQFASGTAITAYMKDVTITPPEMEVEEIKTMGKDSDGFQNSYMEQKPEGLAMISGTLIMQGDEVLETAMTAITTGGSYTTYGYNVEKRSTKSFLVNLDDSTDEVNIVFKSAYLKFGERKPTGTDGHWEQSFEAKCLASNYREQFKD